MNEWATTTATKGAMDCSWVLGREFGTVNFLLGGNYCHFGRHIRRFLGERRTMIRHYLRISAAVRPCIGTTVTRLSAGVVPTPATG
jgi:hypothetical protein